MRTWAHWTAKTVTLTATFAAAGAGFPDTAFAVSGGGGGSTSGPDSPLSGNQVSAPLGVPANVCGNAAAMLGDSLAGRKGTASVRQAAWSSSARGAGSTAGKPMSANRLAGDLAGDSSSGMGSDSSYSLVSGAPMAGAVALKMAGRRIRGTRPWGRRART
jgi:hypothetical protein